MAIDLQRIFDEADLYELPEEARAELVQLVMDQLQTLVGAVLIDLMSDEANDAFQRAHDAGDREGARQILATAVPDYESIVSRQFDRLVAVVADRAEDIRRSTLPPARRAELLKHSAALLRRHRDTRARAYRPEPTDLLYSALYAVRFSSVWPSRSVQELLDRARPGQVVTVWADSFDHEMTSVRANLPLRASGRSRLLPSGARVYSTETVDSVAADIVIPPGQMTSSLPAVIFLAPAPAVVLQSLGPEPVASLWFGASGEE